MTIISVPTKKEEVLKNYSHLFKSLIKAVVDTEKEIIALDGELHSDIEELLREKGSLQENLWGINLYLDKDKAERIEYTALINRRPSAGNNGMEIQDKVIKTKIEEIVYRLIVE